MLNVKENIQASSVFVRYFLRQQCYSFLFSLSNFVAEHKLKQQLGKIRTNISKFQRDLRDVKPSPEFVEKLKEIMEEIENSMMTFKEQQRKVYVHVL